MDMQQIFNQKKEVLTLFILPQQAGDISSISLRKIQFTFSTESILSLINPNNARLKQLEGVKRESSLLIVIMGFFSKFAKKKEQPSSSDKAPAGTTSGDDDEKKERKAEKLASEQPGKQAAASREEIDYVQSTWQQIFPMSGPNKLSSEDLDAKKTAVGVLLFREIFSLAPGALALFSFKDVEDVYESPMLKAHGKAVVGAVDAAVHLLDDVSKLVPILEELGQFHNKKNIVGAHYDVVGQAVVNVIGSALNGLSEAQTNAWVKVYSTIKSVMLAAGK
jgi:hemoglobin-like flavoprotein